MIHAFLRPLRALDGNRWPSAPRCGPPIGGQLGKTKALLLPLSGDMDAAIVNGIWYYTQRDLARMTRCRCQSVSRRTTMPASIHASAISHVALCVRDLERSLQFYRDALGFQVTKDEVQATSRGGLPHLYTARHARRRVVHLRYGDAQSVPFLVLTEHPGEAVSGPPIMLDQVGIRHVSV